MMLKTFDRREWREDMTMESERNRVTSKTPPDDLRKLFPFKVRVLTACKAYGTNPGEVIEYARTKPIPSYFPIECLMDVGREGICPRRVQMNSTEVQLLEA